MTIAIGIDVGATKIAAARVEIESGRVLQHEVRSTRPWRDGLAVLDDCVQLARLLSAAPDAAVGIGLCELVDERGEIAGADTIDWLGLDLVAAFAPMAVVVDSDVRAAARAESMFGSGRTAREFLYLSVGSGISYCLVTDGEPRLGTHGAAILVGAPPVEEVASGPAIARAAGVERAEDAFAVSVHDATIETAASELGRTLAALANALDPELIVVGGGLGLVERYRELVAAAARGAMAAKPSLQPPIVPAALGRSSGVVGAALVGAATGGAGRRAVGVASSQ